MWLAVPRRSTASAHSAASIDSPDVVLDVVAAHYRAVMNLDGWLADTRTSYDTVAVSYADFVRGGLAERPYLLMALSLFADEVRAAGGGPVADVGCGPGEVTATLHGLGVDAFGIDLSPGMINEACRADRCSSVSTSATSRG